MKSVVLCLLATVVYASAAVAGVVFDIETTDHRNDRVVTSQVMAQGRQLKIMVLPSKDDTDGEQASMIFDADRHAMIVVNDKDKSYFVLDKKAIDKLAGQMKKVQDEQMQHMKNMLDKVPEDQRAMIEEMIKKKGGMPGMSESPKPEPAELRKTDESKTQLGYATTKYDVYEGKTKTQEMWVTNWDKIEGGKDVAGLFGEMSEFMKDMMDALSQQGGMQGMMSGQANDAMFEHLKGIQGFPVLTKAFDDKGVSTESALRSSKSEKIDASVFQPPKGYKQRSMDMMDE